MDELTREELQFIARFPHLDNLLQFLLQQYPSSLFEQPRPLPPPPCSVVRLQLVKKED